MNPMIGRSIFLVVTVIVATILIWFFMKEEAKGKTSLESNEVKNKLKVGSHFFKLDENHSCGVVVEKKKTDILISDKQGNENHLTFGDDKSTISYTRVKADGSKVIIIDKDADGLPDIRAVYGKNGKLIVRELLEVIVKPK